MDYTTFNYTVNEDKTVRFAVKQIALPANIIDSKDAEKRFTAVFRAAIEKRILDDKLTTLANMDSDSEEYEKLNIECKLYDKARFTSTIELSDTDTRFIDNMVNALLGFKKASRGVKIAVAGHEPVEKALAPYIEARHSSKALPALKPLKDALNEFCNARLATTNESGVFKNFHVALNDKAIIELLNTIADSIRWNKNGIVTASMNFNKIARNILLIALKYTFKWNGKTAVKSDKITILV